MKYALVLAAASCGFAQTPEKPSTEAVEFFESKIRPVLAKNCYQCHSADAKPVMGGLTVDTGAGIRKGGASGAAVIPGNPSDSPLIRAIRYDGRQMPPQGKLPDAVIADFVRWVAMGAADPREGKSSWVESKIDIEKGRQFWAFQTPKKPATPKVKNGKWSSSPIDRFILSSLEKKRLTPNPDADRATWLRRVTLDLSGLPPAEDEIKAFLQDKSKNAQQKVVDRLLASERFGERWGRHWLDVARYGESSGRGRNFVMPYAWRYRDWVIDAFNQDKPYDRFIREQIAGDLLPSSSEKQRNDQLIGTAFLALGSHDLIEINPAIFEMDVIDEQINATTRAFLALTVGCARCHDHKFDPIPTADYYAMAGIFRSTEMLSGLQRRPRDNISYFNLNLLAKLTHSPGEEPVHLEAARLDRWRDLNQQIEDARRGFLPGQNKKRPQAGNALRQSVAPLLRELDNYPLPPDLAMGARDAKKIADCEVHIRGDVKTLGQAVPRGVVQVATVPGQTVPIASNESGRLQLADWIARRDNPLTARVAVNRVWHHLFGRGLVATVDNFGKMGEMPTHPALLDYLAVRMVEQGWSIKKVIREVVLSRAYRMSAAHNARSFKADPDNNLLWRQNRRRLEVEALRDSLLAVAGELELGRPKESPVMNFRRGFDVGRGIGSMPEDYALKLRTRSVYVPVVRAFIPQMFDVFDFPESSETKGRRDVTTVPTQALFLMNSPFVMELAKKAAARALADSSSDRERVARAYRQTLNREPTPEEMGRTLDYLASRPDPETGQIDELTGWARVYQALFASAEFRYRS